MVTARSLNFVTLSIVSRFHVGYTKTGSGDKKLSFGPDCLRFKCRRHHARSKVNLSHACCQPCRPYISFENRMNRCRRVAISPCICKEAKILKEIDKFCQTQYEKWLIKYPHGKRSSIFAWMTTHKC
jgi:hypothetical protein